MLVNVGYFAYVHDVTALACLGVAAPDWGPLQRDTSKMYQPCCRDMSASSSKIAACDPKKASH